MATSKYLNIVMIKGEGLPSPFFLQAFILFSTIFAQFGSEQWLHPSAHLFALKDTGSYILVYNNYHIGLINFNDSLFTFIKPL